MSVWIWIVAGIGSLFAVSLIVGIAVGAILGRIAREVSELVELEPWSSSPLMRTPDSAGETPEEQLTGREAHRV